MTSPSTLQCPAAIAVIAADGLDFAQLDPMVSAAEKELEGAGVTERPEVVFAEPAISTHEDKG